MKTNLNWQQYNIHQTTTQNAKTDSQKKKGTSLSPELEQRLPPSPRLTKNLPA
jgi:hypothetical protein